ncbi:hypothetical protein VDG1235_2632 [Verrucomicrobiia bacterium DG1235]|nr:hypothetical protein VDG1235_2632 [Verrucomicrobiae bacterium DG1235]
MVVINVIDIVLLALAVFIRLEPEELVKLENSKFEYRPSSGAFDF